MKKFNYELKCDAKRLIPLEFFTTDILLEAEKYLLSNCMVNNDGIPELLSDDIVRNVITQYYDIPSSIFDEYRSVMIDDDDKLISREFVFTISVISSLYHNKSITMSSVKLPKVTLPKVTIPQPIGKSATPSATNYVMSLITEIKQRGDKVSEAELYEKLCHYDNAFLNDKQTALSLIKNAKRKWYRNNDITNTSNDTVPLNDNDTVSKDVITIKDVAVTDHVTATEHTIKDSMGLANFVSKQNDTASKDVRMTEDDTVPLNDNVTMSKDVIRAKDVAVTNDVTATKNDTVSLNDNVTATQHTIEDSMGLADKEIFVSKQDNITEANAIDDDMERDDINVLTPLQDDSDLQKDIENDINDTIEDIEEDIVDNEISDNTENDIEENEIMIEDKEDNKNDENIGFSIPLSNEKKSVNNSNMEIVNKTKVSNNKKVDIEDLELNTNDDVPIKNFWS